MKNYRFYLEYPNQRTKRKGEHSGNVVALCVDEQPYLSMGIAVQGAIVAVHARPDSPVCYGSVALIYLQNQCKRIPEAKAREIHPELFKRLDEKES